MKAIKGKFFSRGIHLRDMKSLSSAAPIEQLTGVEEAVIPLSQHIGKPAVCIVEPGQQVKRGQLIAKADGYVSANVHASIAGTVKAVEDRPDGHGGMHKCVVIASDGSDATDFMPPLPENADGAAIAARIADAGIVGMGGAGFPTHVKIKPAVKVDTLILNGAECEPYLTCDHRIMLERTDDIVRGAQYLAKAIGVEKIMIGIELNKPDAIAAFEKTPLHVVALKKQYPMGSEKHLIYVSTGRKVPIGKLPADAGCIVQNVATALAVCEAVEQGKPLIERVVTVSGKGVETPKNLHAPLGASLASLAAQCSVKEDAVKFVLGGPMTGNALTGLEGSVTKTTSGLLFMTASETNADEPTPCINCGRCADVCPMKLMPMQTEFYTNTKDYVKANTYGGVLSCIECGACSYICPAHRPLAQAIKTAKAELKKKK